MRTEATFAGLDHVARNWGWFLALGIVLIILGAIAIVFAELATFVSVLVFGWILLVAGVLEIIHGFRNHGWGGFLLNLIVAVLNIVLGLLFLAQPMVGAVGLTLLLAAFFFVSGTFRIIAVADLRFPNWGWALFSGIITVLLGIGLWIHWPISGLWFIGLAVGIEMIFRGWSWVAFAISAHRLSTESVHEPSIETAPG